MCEDVGMPPEDTKLICRFLDDIDEKLADNFTMKDLEKAINKSWDDHNERWH
jgi:hypothetical protein